MDETAGPSLATQVVIALAIISVAFLSARAVRGVLRLVAALLGALLPTHPVGRKPKKVSSESELSSGTPLRKEAAQQQQQPQGISLKQLQKDSNKHHKGGQGPDRHAESELFVATLKGHTDAVTGVSWSPDGQLVATACDDRMVRVFSVGDPYAKNLSFRKKELRTGVQDVAFAGNSQHVAVQTKGLVNAAGLLMLDFSPREPEELWAHEAVHAKLPGVCLRSAHSCRGGHGLLLSCCTKTDLRVYNASGGREMGSIDSGGLTNFTAAISKDGRWIAAATFTSDVKVYEVMFDRLGAFTGIKKAMDLKGHRSKVHALDFSPDLTKAVTASADGLLKVWNLNVRYAMQEDPKILLTTGLSLPPSKCYSQLAWGPRGFIAATCGALVHFIDSKTGEVVARIDQAHEKEITCVEWSPVKLSGPQGKFSVLATGSLDGRVRLWKGPKLLV